MAKKQNKKIYPTEYVLCIDPGIGGTGLAYFQKGDEPTYTETLKSQSKTWTTVALNITYSLRGVIGGDCPDITPLYVVIEWPSLWSGSAKSYSAGIKGDLFKLTSLIGMLIHECGAYHYSDGLILLPVADWKGQLSKKAVDARIKRVLGKKYPNHVSDAVGMGLFLKGLL